MHKKRENQSSGNNTRVFFWNDIPTPKIIQNCIQHSEYDCVTHQGNSEGTRGNIATKKRVTFYRGCNGRWCDERGCKKSKIKTMILSWQFGPQNLFSPKLVLGILNNVMLSDISWMFTWFLWGNDSIFPIIYIYIFIFHQLDNHFKQHQPFQVEFTDCHYFFSLVLVTGRCFSNSLKYFTGYPPWN